MCDLQLVFEENALVLLNSFLLQLSGVACLLSELLMRLCCMECTQHKVTCE